MTETTKPLSKREREALEVFRHARDGQPYYWKGKTMERLAERGLVQSMVCQKYKCFAFVITPAGRQVLEDGA